MERGIWFFEREQKVGCSDGLGFLDWGGGLGGWEVEGG